jgi:outer membrane protein assembly factor BamE (lipoprotein component of BamABCDE complex)
MKRQRRARTESRTAGGGRVRFGGLVLLACGILGAGCATVGHPFPPEQVQQIRVGSTTKTELLGVFGLPYRRGIDDGDSTWTYLHYRVRLFGEHLRTRDLYVRFDERGLVKSYSYNSNMED